MKSDVVRISSGGSGIEEALELSDRVAGFAGLDRKSAIRLRLMAEEMTGMFMAIVGEQEADFWIEKDGEKFELHLLTTTELDSEQRAKLIAASTSKRNETTGFMSKLRSVFEAAVTSMNSGYSEAVNLGLVESSGGFTEWTLSQYKAEAEKEQWDELEQSVVAQLADEIRVKIVGLNVEMIIDKTF